MTGEKNLTATSCSLDFAFPVLGGLSQPTIWNAS
jgi:hypothetical protein